MIMKYFCKQYKICALVVVCSFLMITHSNAQQQKKTTGLSPEVIAWTVSTMEPWPQDKYNSLKEAMIDNKIFIPLVFRGGLFTGIEFKFNRDSLRLNDWPPLHSPFAYKSKSMSPMYSHYEFLKSLDDMIYREVMLPNPHYFKYSFQHLPSTVIRPTSIETSKDVVKLEIRAATPPLKEVDHIIKFIPDRKYWTSTFAADIKFSQNKSSVNWHKGEINNMNIYTNTNTTYNYARKNITLTNTLLTNFTITNAPNDTLRNYTIGTDELRFRSVFQLKAFRNWNYSSSAEFITSMGNKYIPNTDIKNAAFLSPFTVNTGLGMTYAVKPKFKKADRAVDLSLTIEPLSFKYMHSKDKNINLAAYFKAKEDGTYEHNLKTFGSTINLTQITKFSKNVALNTRLYYFTNYERVISEFENKLDIILSRYFSTTIHLYLRYDDGVKQVEGSDTFLQVNEMFSFGFAYRW